MPKTKVPENFKRYRFSVPNADISVTQWIEAQSNLSYSIRELIKTAIRCNGFTDVSCYPVRQIVQMQAGGMPMEYALISQANGGPVGVPGAMPQVPSGSQAPQPPTAQPQVSPQTAYPANPPQAAPTPFAAQFPVQPQQAAPAAVPAEPQPAPAPQAPKQEFFDPAAILDG